MCFDRTWKSLCMTKIKRLIYKPSHNCTLNLSLIGSIFSTLKYISTKYNEYNTQISIKNDFLFYCSFGKRIGGAARRHNECLILEPSEMIVVRVVHHEFQSPFFTLIVHVFYQHISNNSI